MSPRAGGQADKFGNRYEGRWTVGKVLDVLAGRAASIVVEEVGEGGEGVEFSSTRNDGATEAHQVKRQHGNANGWSIRNLDKEGVLASAAAQVRRGREFHFISVIPARKLDELTDRARRADDLQAFVDGLSRELAQEFNTFKTAVGTAEDAFIVLQSLFIRWPDERHIRATNAALAALLISGAPPPAAAVVLGDLVLDNLGRTLDAETIREKLGEYELTTADLMGVASVAEAVRAVYDSWQASIERELLDPVIPRAEADEIRSALNTTGRRLVLAAGAAGAGKSAVLHQVVSGIAEERPVLALRLDRIEPFSSTHELGVERLGLPASPVASLAAVAGDRECLLVVDQLDAVSRASGRMPQTFDAVAELLREANAFPAMRVLLACRKFDIDNDDRLRGLVSADDAQFTIPPLSEPQVTDAVRAMGLDPDVLTAQQRELLSSPLHLVLLHTIADEDDALGFTTSKDLLDAYWERKRRDCGARREVRFGETIGVLVDYMSENQRLVAPEAILDSPDLLDDADVLASEHVLVRGDHKINFFHEAFFDYAFARLWIVRGESLVEFLRAGEQELFRRAQVRQVLTHLRDDDPERFIAEIRTVLDEPDIRFHIKEVVFAILRALPDPTQAEWQLVEQQLTAGHRFAPRLWAGLRTGPWFDRLDSEGAIKRWLGSKDSELEVRALEIMVSAPDGREPRLAELLAPHAHHKDFPRWLRFVTQYRELAASRGLFDLVLGAVLAGRYDDAGHELWLFAHGLGEAQPEWASELLGAWLNDRTDALALDPQGQVAELAGNDYQAGELVDQAAAGSPYEFCARIIPFLLRAMAATSEEGVRPLRDRHFAYRTWNFDAYYLAGRLLHATSEALEAMARDGHDRLDALLSTLAADEHDGAQWLLYQALIASAPQRADYAAELLLQGEHRLDCGYICQSYWTTRELLSAISPAITDELFGALEAVVMAVAPEWEGRPGGYTQFTLLSGLAEDRLSEAGRRRLGELRRRFNREQPNEPMGVRGGVIGPPIPASAAQHMTDEQWLGAIAKHNSEKRDWGSFTGGAEQQARVLEAETKSDPSRFARFCLSLDGTTHPAYVDGVLQGLGSTEIEVDPNLVFDAIRHTAALGQTEHDRWIPWALRRHMAGAVPDDLIQLVLDRALHSPDPDHDAWMQEAPSGGKYYGGDPWHDGMNTARGEACLVLGDLLLHDSDGHRTSLVVDSFPKLASDPAVCVRACAARVLAAGLRHARAEAVEAFQLLIDTDDRLLACDPVEQLIIYVGFGDSETVRPVIKLMLTSEHDNVREAGGRLAAFAALELGLGDLLAGVADADPGVRRGAARLCARRLPIAGDGLTAANALRIFFDDEEATVRQVAAEVAGTLRGRELRPHAPLLDALIASPAFSDAVPQLLLTLEYATERVDDLVLLTAHRFLYLYRGQLDTFAAPSGDAKEVGELVLRAYAQASDADGRRHSLDLVDELLAQAAYIFSDVVGEAER